MDKNYCIFDLDGTLTDSMPYWKRLGGDYLRGKGIEPDERLLWMVKAMTMTQGAEYFIKTYGLSDPAHVIVAEMEAMMGAHYQNDVPLKPGVAEYLAALCARGAKLCVATATAEPLARACLTRLGVADCFQFISSCESIGVSKDRPDLYLLAAQRLGAAPEDCAVFEDALYAARTAREAGFYTVGIFEESSPGEFPALEALCHETITDWRVALGFTHRLYAAARPIWEGYHRHPFVTGLGDGSLSPEKFRFFMVQDYLYLYEYVRVFALGVAKAGDRDLMGRFSASVDHILNREMDIHRAYLARLGVTEAALEGADQALPNLSYTSYMLSVAYTGGPAEIVAAILACSWSYAEIGARLAVCPGAADHPLFGAWVQGYASGSYQAANRDLMALMDRLAEGLPEQTLRRLEDIFVQCSQYEAGFWDMAWEGAH